MRSPTASAFETGGAPWYAARVHDGDPEDGELVARVAEGGPAGRDAERLLCARFAPRIRLYGLRHLRDPGKADDLVQIVLLGVLEAARGGRIEDRVNVHRFVLGVSRNSALRLRQTDGRATPAPSEELERLAGGAPPPERVDLGKLAQCFDHLDGRAKDVVVQSFQEGRSAVEIAARLAMTEGNVRVVRHRAIAALRRCLDGERGASGGAP